MSRFRMPLRRDGVRLTEDLPATAVGGEQHDWFLTATERGNPRARIRPWTEGNQAAPLVHGRRCSRRPCGAGGR